MSLPCSTSRGQTYAGFGPEHPHWPSDEGKFDVHTVRPYGVPPPDHSTVVADGPYKTFTIPISEEQARAAREEISKIQSESPSYDAFSPDPRVCTTIVNRITKAAGFGDNLLYTLPSRSMQYVADIESTLGANPNAKFMIDGAGRPVRIPDALRDVQQEYASVGGGVRYAIRADRARARWSRELSFADWFAVVWNAVTRRCQHTQLGSTRRARPVDAVPPTC